MSTLAFVFIFTVIHCPLFSNGEVTLKPVGTVYLPYKYNSGVGSFSLSKGAAEQSSYDPINKMVYTVGETGLLHIIDVSDPSRPIVALNVTLPQGIPTDIEVCDYRVAVSIANVAVAEPGKVVLYSLYHPITGTFKLLKEFTVGALPDMLVFSKYCGTILVANEGQAGKDASGSFADPEGSVSIIKLKRGIRRSKVKTLTFSGFDYRANDYVADGVRWVFRNVTPASTQFSQDLEPEYITFSYDYDKAYVALQENNAVAVLDLEDGQECIEEIYPLGYKQWNITGGFDASDKDGVINIRPWNVFGMYQPDSIKYFVHGGVEYIATANEGDAKEYSMVKDGLEWEEETKGTRIVADVADSVGDQMKADLADKKKLGRLRFTTTEGKDENGKFRSFYSYGGRSFAIWRAEDMSLVWDSGSDIEKTHKEFFPSIFNNELDKEANTPEEDRDRRSDNKGPECESLAIAQVGTKTVFFIGNERTSSISIYSMTSPSTTPIFESLYRAGGLTDTWAQLYADRNIGDIDPEDVQYIPAHKSPNKKPMLLVSGSVSGTVSMYEIQGLFDKAI